LGIRRLLAFGVILLPALAWAQEGSPADPLEHLRFEKVRTSDRLEKDGALTRVVEVRVLLRSTAAVSEFGQIAYPFVHTLGEVQFETVTIEKPDGRVTNVTTGHVEDVNPFGLTATSTPADVRFRKMTIPGLEPGDRLSYRLTARQKPIVPGHVFGAFTLTTLAGEPQQIYELDLPRQGSHKVRLRKALEASCTEVPSAADRRVRRLVHKVPMPPTNRRLTKAEAEAATEPDVLYSSFSSWSDVARWWWAFSKERLEPDESVKTEARRLIPEKVSERQAVEAILPFVASRIRYLSVGFGLGRMQPRGAADVLSSKYGDCKDKHALLAAMARSVGVDVRPVLINSGRVSLFDDIPGPQQFDHLISVVRLGADPAGWIWLDSTNAFGGPGYLPPALRDKPALLVEPSGEGTIVRTPAEPPFASRREVAFKGILDSSGDLKGKFVWHLRSDEEVFLRAAFAQTPRDRLTAFVKDLVIGYWKDVEVQALTFSDPLDTKGAFRVEFDAAGRAPLDPGLSIPVPAFDLPVMPAAAADAEAEAAELAVRELAVRAEVEVPEGASVKAPLSITLERKFGSFRSRYTVEGRAIQVERTAVFSVGEVPAAERDAYESLRKAIETDRRQQFAVSGMAGAVEAAALKAEGLAALKAKDYAKAVELLEKATQIDPKIQDGFVKLGEALNGVDRNADAVAAFTRQIENSPFHEKAYSWRAYALEELGRGDEADADLLKQVEVSPFDSWSIERLAKRRMDAGRYAEAAEFYQRAAAINPKDGGNWVGLGDALADEGKGAEARKALEQARGLEITEQEKRLMARAYRRMGDAAAAGSVAEQLLDPLTARLAALERLSFEDADREDVRLLAEAWYLVGRAALEASDHAKAERYLRAAWMLEFLPEAGWAMGDLRERQGRLADAVEAWSMAASVPGAPDVLPEDHQARIAAACRKLPEPDATARPKRVLLPGEPAKPLRQIEAQARLTEVRTVRLTGPSLSDLAEEVVLLAGADGLVERLSQVSAGKPGSVGRQMAKLGAIRLPDVRPDERPFKALRRGLLACSAVSGCALVLDLPGLRNLVRSYPSRASFASLAPADGTALRPGEMVRLAARVRYEIGGRDSGFIGLAVFAEPGGVLSALPPAAVKAGSGEVELKARFVVPDGATHIRVSTPLFGAQMDMRSLSLVSATYRVQPPSETPVVERPTH
jgi:tetratricopeptide (TPR) repeat protein